MHGLDTTIPIYTLRRKPYKGDPWLKIAFDWWLKVRFLHEGGADVSIVNGVIPLRFRSKISVNHGITLSVNKLYFIFAKELYKRYDEIVCVSTNEE